LIAIIVQNAIKIYDLTVHSDLLFVFQTINLSVFYAVNLVYFKQE